MISKNKSIKGYTPVGQLGILLAFFGGGLVIAVIIQAIIGFSMLPPGTGMSDMQKELTKAVANPNNATMIQLMQVSGAFFMMFAPSWLYNRTAWGKDMIWLGFSKYFNWQQIALGFALIFLANIIAQPLADFTKWAVAHWPQVNSMAQRMEDTYNDQVKAISNLQGWGDYFIALIIMAFCAAMFEEVFFRGGLQNVLERWFKNPVAALIVTALLFSIIHMSIYLFISRFVLGIILGLLYQRSKNIWVNIIAHFLNNAIAVSQMFYLAMQKKAIKADDLDPHVPWWGAVVAIVITIALFKLYEKLSAMNRQRVIAKEQVLIANADPFAGFANNISNN